MTDTEFEAGKALTNAKFATYLSVGAVILSVLSAIGALWVFNGITETDSKENMNTIALSITVLQTVLAVGAFAGFWLIRGSAQAAAREAAAECSPACTDKWLTANMESRLVNYFSTKEGRELVAAVASDHSARDNVTETSDMEEVI